MTHNIDRHIIVTDASLIQALEQLNSLSGGVMTLMVTHPDGRMAGTLTDGDVRRALLSGVELSAPVTAAMHAHFKWLADGNIDVDRLRQYRRDGITLVPVLDSDGRIARFIDTRVTRTELPLRAILMAGGRGERLRPLTLDCPKPLLKIGDKPIIDYNIEALASVGVTDVTVMVNYLAEMIEHHFSQPVAGISVKCKREKEFLGTIGAAALVEHRKGGNTLVMNSDLLTTLSFEEMYLRHMREKAAVTIAAVPYNVSIPYAILATEGEQVKALEEKPSYTYYANAGIYIFADEVLAMIPRGERMDAPDLIELAIARGLKVVYYPIDGTWIDIGSPRDFDHARELMNLRKM